MINNFLARLDNIPTPPGHFVWPEFSPWEPGVQTTQLRRILLGDTPHRYEHFLRSLQLTMLVSATPSARKVTANDPRVAYDRELMTALRHQGFVVHTTGSGAQVRAAVTQATPSACSWTVSVDGPAVTITDDTGASTTASPGFTNEVSAPVPAPNNLAVFYFHPWVDGDAWSISYSSGPQEWATDMLSRLDEVGATLTVYAREFRNAVSLTDKLALATVEAAGV